MKAGFAVATAAIVLLAALAVSTASAQVAAPPLTNAFLENGTVLAMFNTSSSIYAIVSINGKTVLYNISVSTAQLLPQANTTPLLQYSQPPTMAAIDSLHKPRYLAAATANGLVIITDLDTNTTQEFATPGRPVSLVFLNNTLLLLENTAAGNILYAFVPTRLGWYEARLRVGNLLPERLENIEPTTLVPLYTSRGGMLEASGKALLIARTTTETANLTKAATLAGVVLYAKTLNATVQPLTNITVYLVDTTLGRMIAKGTTDKTGSFKLPIPPQFNQLTLYVEYNGSCYGYTIKPADLVKTGENLYVLKTPIVITPTTLPSVCPTEQQNIRLFLVEPGESPLKPLFRVIGYNASTSLTIHLAYLDPNTDIIYLVATAPGPDGRQALYIQAVNAKNLQPIPEASRYYYSVSTPIAATVSPGGKIILIVTADGIVYIASRTRNTYELIWSFNAGSSSVALTAGRAGAAGYYLAAAAAKDGYLSIAYVNPDKLTGFIYTYHGGTPYIETGFETTQVTIRGKSLVLGTQNKGIVVINNVGTMEAAKEEGRLATLSPYTVVRAAIRVLDELGKPVPNFRVNYEEYMVLNGTRVTVYRGTAIGHNGTAYIRVVPILNLTLHVIPLDDIHEPVTATASAEQLIGGNYVLTAQLRTLQVSLVLRDGYTGGPPETPLEIMLSNEEIKFNTTLRVKPGTTRITIGLKPGTYMLRIIDTTGTYYETKEETISVQPNTTTYEVTLRRINAYVRVTLTTKYHPKVNDELVVRLVAADGRKLGEVKVDAPLPGVPRRVVFNTPYRGDARVEIVALPVKYRNPFYRDYVIPVKIVKPTNEVTVELEPRLYGVTVQLLAPNGEAVNATFRVYLFNTTRLVAEETGTLVRFELRRGNYTLVAEPVAEGLPFPLYGTAMKHFSVDGNVSIKLNTTIERMLTNITIVDAYSPNKQLIDTVKVVLDRKTVAVIKKGQVGNLRLPILLKGSNITLISENGIYERYSKIIKPSNKTLVIVYPRKLFDATIYIVNDVGQPVGGATVTFTGLGLRYTTTVISLPDGSATTKVPYGEYRICVDAPGYNPVCTTAAITSAFKTSIVVTPKPLTIVMRYINLIAVVVFAIVMAVIIRLYFKKVLEKFTTEEEF